MPEGRALYISYDGVLESVAQSQALGYVKGLSEKGFKFWIVSFEKIHNLSDRAYIEELDRELKDKGITWLRMRYHDRPKIISTFFDVLSGIFFCLPIVKKNKIGIIHARAEVPAAIALVLSRVFRIKFIYDRRGILAHDYVDGGMWPKNSVVTRIAFKFVNALDKKFLFFSDYIILLTQRIAAIVRDDFLRFKFSKEPRIKVIPCCVDIERFKPADKERGRLADLSNKFILTYAGSLGNWYMLSEMIDFYIRLKAVKSEAHLVIATLSDHAMVENTLRSKKLLQSEYTLTGRKYRDMPELIASADAAIMFIKPVYSKIASCPTKFGEFLASGVPIVINSGIGDTEDIINEKKVGVVVKGFTEGDYRDSVERLLRLKAEGEVLRQRCRETAINYFSLEDGVNKYLEVYNALI